MEGKNEEKHTNKTINECWEVAAGLRRYGFIEGNTTHNSPVYPEAQKSRKKYETLVKANSLTLIQIVQCFVNASLQMQ